MGLKSRDRSPSEWKLNNNKSLHGYQCPKRLEPFQTILQQVTVIAYQDGSIKEPTKSKLLRFFVTLSMSRIRKEQEIFLPVRKSGKVKEPRLAM